MSNLKNTFSKVKSPGSIAVNGYKATTTFRRLVDFVKLEISPVENSDESEESRWQNKRLTR